MTNRMTEQHPITARWSNTPSQPMDDLRQASADASGVQILSPAAQAVLDAVLQKSNLSPTVSIAAAALRAAVDQAIPLTKTPWGTTLIPVLTSRESRDRLLAIADELEGHNAN